MMNPFQFQQKEVKEFLLFLEYKKKCTYIYTHIYVVYKVTKTSLLVVDYKVSATQVTSEHYECFLPLLFNTCFCYYLFLPIPGLG